MLTCCFCLCMLLVCLYSLVFSLPLCLPHSPPLSVGIPSSPVITDTVTSPGLLLLRVCTVYPGDTNIRFIVNITNVSDGSIISCTTHQFNTYQSNDIVNISISIPDGGSVSVSIVTINQYGSSDIINIPQVFTIDPSEYIIILMCHHSTLHSSIQYYCIYHYSIS